MAIRHYFVVEGIDYLVSEIGLESAYSFQPIGKQDIVKQGTAAVIIAKAMAEKIPRIDHPR